MILKMQCSIEPPSWHYADHIEDLHYDVLPKIPETQVRVSSGNPDVKVEFDERTPFQKATEGDDCADRVVVMNKNHIDYHSINVVRTDRLGKEVKEWYITDGEVYILNDEGKTLERIR